MENITAPQIIEKIGVSAIAARMEITADAVYRAKANGKLPASWYHALCDMAGVPLPVGEFSFKGVSA